LTLVLGPASGVLLKRSAASRFSTPQNGDSSQVADDLFGVVDALAALGQDEEALEVAGIVESLMAEAGRSIAYPTRVVSRIEFLRDTEQRIGPARAAELKDRGRAVPAAERVARACQLARSHAPAHATARG
jgi:hypothetical protein